MTYCLNHGSTMCLLLSKSITDNALHYDTVGIGGACWKMIGCMSVWQHRNWFTHVTTSITTDTDFDKLQVYRCSINVVVKIVSCDIWVLSVAFWLCHYSYLVPRIPLWQLGLDQSHVIWGHLKADSDWNLWIILHPLMPDLSLKVYQFMNGVNNPNASEKSCIFFLEKTRLFN